MSGDGDTEEWKPLELAGRVRRMVTGKALTITLSGKRNIGVPGNDYVADSVWRYRENGTMAKAGPVRMEVVFESASICTGSEGFAKTVRICLLSTESGVRISGGTPKLPLKTGHFRELLHIL